MKGFIHPFLFINYFATKYIPLSPLSKHRQAGRQANCASIEQEFRKRTTCITTSFLTMIALFCELFQENPIFPAQFLQGYSFLFDDRCYRPSKSRAWWCKKDIQGKSRYSSLLFFWIGGCSSTNEQMKETFQDILATSIASLSRTENHYWIQGN